MLDGQPIPGALHSYPRWALLAQVRQLEERVREYKRAAALDKGSNFYNRRIWVLRLDITRLRKELGLED